jgi:pyruvate kinase
MLTLYINPCFESCNSHRSIVPQVRLNMTHSDHAWHADVISKIRELNKSGFNIAVMIDTEGSEAHLKAQDPMRVEVRSASGACIANQTCL